MAGETKYRIGTVSKMTGLSTHTLRMWEKRYAAVLPMSVQAEGRLYTDADVERLRLLHMLVSSGHSIGRMAKLPDADLQHMAANRYLGTYPKFASASSRLSSNFKPNRPKRCWRRRR